MNKQNTAQKISDYDLDNNIGFLISDAHRLMTAAVDKRMASLGLTRSQLRVILFLSRQNGSTQVELADSLGIGKVAMGDLLTRLTEKKLITRIVHPEDKRARKVYLSKQITALYQPMSELGDGLMEELLEGISKKQRQQLVSNLKTIKENSKKIIDEN